MGSSQETPDVRSALPYPNEDPNRPRAKGRYGALWRRDRGVYVATSILDVDYQTVTGYCWPQSAVGGDAVGLGLRQRVPGGREAGPGAI